MKKEEGGRESLAGKIRGRSEEGCERSHRLRTTYRLFARDLTFTPNKMGIC